MLVRGQALRTKKEKRDHYTRLAQQCKNAADRARNEGFKELWLNLAADLERRRRTFYPIGEWVLKGKKK